MNNSARLLGAALVAAAMTGVSAQAAEIVFDGSVSTDFADTNNWVGGSYPTSSDYAVLNTTAELTTATPNNIQALRIAQVDANSVGVLNVRGTNAYLNANSSSNWDSHIGRKGHGTLNILEGGQAHINFAEIGREPGATGIVNVVEGYLRFTRGSRYGGSGYSGNVSYSVHVGANDHTGGAGYGEINVSGGSFVTRFGIEFGNPTRETNIGKFSVQGTNAVEITIGDTNDGYWMQNTNSTLEIGIDGGVTPINVLENGDGKGAGGAKFAAGAILDVGFINGYSATGTWPVMNCEGSMVNLGLVLSDEAVAAGWNAGIDGNTLYVAYGEDAPGDLEPLTTPIAPSSISALPTSNYVVTVTWEEALLADSYTVQRATTSGGPYTVVAGGLTSLSYADTVPAVDTRYYYTVYGVNDQGDGAVSPEDDAYALDATIIDSGAETYGDAYESYSMFDNDTTTHYDTKSAGAWAGLDFGAGNEKQILEVVYITRNYSPWATKVYYYATNATFEASNDADFSNSVILHTVPTDIDAPPAWNAYDVSEAGSYRYVRVKSADNLNNKAFAEVLFMTSDDYTAAGTPKYWLDNEVANASDDYEAAEATDADGDSFTAGEEYIAGTDPNDADDFLKINSVSNTNGLVITWSSVEGRNYSIITNTSLSVGTPGTLVSGIAGVDGETAYTGTVSGASTVFYEIGVSK